MVSDAEFKRLADAVTALQAGFVNISTGQAATSQSVRTLTEVVKELSDKLDPMVSQMAVIKEREDARKSTRLYAVGALIVSGIALAKDWIFGSHK